MPLRIVFMGTPDYAVPTLIELVGHGHDVVAVYSQPPRPAGRRGLELKESPVHRKAKELGIPVFTPESFRDVTTRNEFEAHRADVAVVIAYGLLLPDTVLNAPELGCYNGHASLLPRWRGAAPIQRAIMAGDNQTGVCIMKMDEGLDTGAVALEERIAISQNSTAGELHDQLSILTADLMTRAMAALERGSLQHKEQPNDGVTYAHKISKDEARIDWSRPSDDLHNHVRGLSPFPGSWCEMLIGESFQRVKILFSEVCEGSGDEGELLDDRLAIACGSGALRPLRLQRSGKKVQELDEFLRGSAVKAVR